MRKSWMITFEADAERKAREAGDGDRDCARGERCASGAREQQPDGTWIRKPARTYQQLCHSDRSILADCLLAMPATYRRLAAALGDHVVAEAVVRSPFGPSVPLRCDVDELMRGLVDACMSWLERVASVARLSCPPTESWRRRALNGHAVSLLEQGAPVLHAHVDTVLSLTAEPMLRPSSSPAARLCEVVAARGDTVLMMADGSVAALEVLALDWRARAALLETPPAVVRLLGVACRNCDRRALRLAPPKEHDSDADIYSICVFCRDAMDEAEYKAWCKAWARHYEQQVSPAQLAAGVR